MPTYLQLLEKANRTSDLFDPSGSQLPACVPRGFSAPGFSAPADVSVDAPHLTFRYRQQFLDLANQLLAPKKEGESFSIGICPVRREDSVGRFVSLFATSMSELSKSPVLLIETNFRRPSLARYLGAPDSPGLREMIAPAPKNRFDCIHPTRHRNLHLLPAGAFAAGREPRDFKPGLEWLYGMVSRHFQSVIIAFPAWNECSGAQPSYGLADAMLLAVQPDSCGGFKVRRAVRHLRKASANLVGSILNELEQ